MTLQAVLYRTFAGKERLQNYGKFDTFWSGKGGIALTDQSQKALFALVRNTLLGTALPPDLSPSAAMWAEIFQVASDHDILQLLFDAVSRNHLLPETSKGFQKGKEQYLLATTRIVKIEEAQANIVRTLEEAEIDFVLLKGSILRPLYPQMWMRTSCDIDILVHPEDLERTGKLLADKLAFTYAKVSTLHDISLFDAGGVHLELHHQLYHDAKDPMLQAVWEHLDLLPNHKHAYRMTAEFFAYYHLAHMKMHILSGGCGIRSFLDWWIIQNKLSYDKNQLSARLAENKMDAFADAVDHLSRYWLEGGTLGEQEKQLSEYVIRGGSFGTEESHAVVQSATATSKFAHYFRRLFLPYRYLCNLYPWLKGRKWLYPVATAMRWFSVFDPVKRKSLGVEIKSTIQSAGQEQAQVGEMMKHLGF